MSLAGQRLQADRYKIVPRTLSFLVQDGKVLLLRLAEAKDAWAGHYNGVGGHVERGENPLDSARREILEEVGLQPSELKLCGVVVIDTRSPIGIGLYVFVGRAPRGELRPGAEGSPEWVALSALADLPLVEDLPQLIPRALAAYDHQATFCAHYSYDESGQLTIDFGRNMA